MPTTLDEGTFGQAAAGGDLVYPNINSCLTLTVVNGDNSLVGAHAVLAPENGQADLETLVGQIASALAEPKKLYLVGDTGTWFEALGQVSSYERFSDISKAFELGNKFEVIDVQEYTDGGKKQVRIEFLADGKLYVKSNDGVTTHENKKF